MSESLEKRLVGSLAGSPLAERLAPAAAPLLERATEYPVLDSLEGDALMGLARVLATRPESARYLSSRPALVERVAGLDAATLERRARQLEQIDMPADPRDLELFLDSLRLVRRDETVLAACAQLSGLVPFERVSAFLSSVAETCIAWALRAADPAASPPRLAVLGMGKIAGREFTYHSDLDLIFLYPDGQEEGSVPARIAQRMIGYLTRMTGAGVAYAVDSRLRPSGRQGALVSSFASFTRYQRDRAATWEHLALVRARALAGDVEGSRQLLESLRREVVERGRFSWDAIGDMRRRVEAERGRESDASLAFKTGRGGLMDVEFLAAGSLLERRATLETEAPSIPALLRAAVSGRTLEGLLEAYAFLRRVEACARWLAGRAVESLSTEGEPAGLVAELVEPGLGEDALLERVGRARDTIRSAWDRVIGAHSIAALAG